MTLPARLLALLLLALVLATSTGVEPSCGGPVSAPADHAAPHGGHHPQAPTGHHGGQPCPVLPGAACLSMTGCLPTGAPPAAQTMVLVPAASIQMVATASPALLTRDITPDSPPPRT
ncbi:MAG: hypothetical protein U0104_14055 [Gemmatimonadales bacterium]|nr:hypothetical protein [Gemmatimonadales bacterium]